MKTSFINRFSNQIILALVATAILTTIAAGLPAYWLLRNESQRQAWHNVSNGVNVTNELLSSEQTRIADLTLHASQRPTLLSLLAEGKYDILNEYIRTFEAGVNIDFIEIGDRCGNKLVNSPFSLSLQTPPYPMRGTFYTLTETTRNTAILATQPILLDDLDCEAYITLGIVLDDEFIEQLSIKSGFEHSIIIDNNRMGTSFETMPEIAETSTSMPQGDAEGLEHYILNANGGKYFAAILPLISVNGDEIAGLEVALSVLDLERANLRAVLTLIAFTLFVVILVSVLGAFYARRLTDPLDKLTSASIKTSQGDLLSPIQVPEGPYEVSVLASAFEESRRKILTVLDNLSRSKERADLIIQSISDGIITLDQNNQVTSFSKAAETISGWKSEEILGNSINQIFPVQASNEKFMDFVPASGGVHQVKAVDRDGKPIILMATTSKLPATENETEQILLTIHDATEEEATQQIRAYFIANISHEFRTPLSALNASVELLMDEISDMSRAEIVELLNSIHYSVAGLQTLIDNLLESTSIEAGHFRIRRRKTDLNNVIAEAVRVMEPLLTRRHQKLLVSEPPTLPKAYVDPTRITQVLVNLLSNASKYSPIEETIELWIEVIEGSHLYFAVADRGPGIAAQDQQNLFQRFVRLGEKDGTQYGVGLGLSVVKTIIEEHGGKVGVDLGQIGGSIFWFTLPLERK